MKNKVFFVMRCKSVSVKKNCFFLPIRETGKENGFFFTGHKNQVKKTAKFLLEEYVKNKLENNQ